mgnify:CR=1 FL=1
MSERGMKGGARILGRGKTVRAGQETRKSRKERAKKRAKKAEKEEKKEQKRGQRRQKKQHRTSTIKVRKGQREQ